MKVAVVSESPADEAAIRILLDGLLGSPTEVVTPVRTRPRGWSDVLRVLPTVIRELHYQTDADAFVVVVDSDRSPPHTQEHESSGEADEKCRLCSMRALAEQTLARVSPVPGRSPLRFALGLAVPAVEAWYQCGVDKAVSEATWTSARQSNIFPYDVRRLKQDVYGTDRPSLGLETARAVEEAERLVREKKLELLEQLFPGGFGAMARSVRKW